MQRCNAMKNDPRVQGQKQEYAKSLDALAEKPVHESHMNDTRYV